MEYSLPEGSRAVSKHYAVERSVLQLVQGRLEMFLSVIPDGALPFVRISPIQDLPAQF